jgi:hypothetical protein
LRIIISKPLRTVIGLLAKNLLFYALFIRDAPDTVLPDIQPAGYPTNPKAGFWISGRIPDIQPDICFDI